MDRRKEEEEEDEMGSLSVPDHHPRRHGRERGNENVHFAPDRDSSTPSTLRWRQEINERTSRRISLGHCAVILHESSGERRKARNEVPNKKIVVPV